jgi:beta-glucosidase
LGFSGDFLWGVATSAFQIEGAVNEDGRKPSIWDTFTHQQGNIYENQNADIACDHYHLFHRDVAMMKELGIKAYRFSISWSRVLPDGVGKVNQKGIQFYHELIEDLLSAGIEPVLTLYHWDLPQVLYNRGGWLNPESAEWFEEYTRVIAENYGNHIKYYITFNEPNCFLGVAHMAGVHAPGTKLPVRDILQMSHHVLLAHGRAVKVLRSIAGPQCKIGFAPTGPMHYPKSSDPDDVEAARKAVFSIEESIKFKALNLRMWYDPIFLGKYPDEALALYGDQMPRTEPGDMELISQPVDFIGQNIYNGHMVQADESSCGFSFVERPFSHPRVMNNWPVTPESLYWGPKFLYERYGKPIMITENGLPMHDMISLDGKVHDPLRIDGLTRYLSYLKRVVDDGIPVAGYFLWSLMDNFEWALGYPMRFGLIYVNYDTQERIYKDSAQWYREVIQHNGDNLPIV